MNYTTLASDAEISTTAQALKQNNFEPVIVNNKDQALEKIKELIPQDASVMNGASRTLEQIGFVDLLKSGTHGWNNLHAAIAAETDPAKQAALRRQAVLSDFYLGSVHALTQTGEMVIASNTGSQLPHIVFTSPNLIFVVGTQKIVADVPAGQQRLREYVVPLEDQNMRNKYGVGTHLNKELLFHGENIGVSKRKIWIIIVKEQLGF